MVLRPFVTTAKTGNDITDRVDEDDVRVVDFPQHLLNVSLSTASSVTQ